MAADTSFTLTRRDRRAVPRRPAATRGSLRAPFEIWDLSHVRRAADGLPALRQPDAARRAQTVALGRTGGQCGYLKTKPRRVFPFAPTAGTWTFQLDTHRGYARHPGGPVARIRVGIA